MAEKSGSPAAATAEEQQPQQFLSNFIAEIIKSPVNLALVGLIAILVYKIVKSRTKTEEPVQEVKKLPKLRRDFAIEELTKYDGKGPDGRILVAVNGSVYDVTRGSKFYGPGEFEATYRRSIFFFFLFSLPISRAGGDQAIRHERTWIILRDSPSLLLFNALYYIVIFINLRSEEAPAMISSSHRACAKIKSRKRTIVVTNYASLRLATVKPVTIAVYRDSWCMPGKETLYKYNERICVENYEFVSLILIGQ